VTKIYSLGAFLTRTFAKRWWHQRLMGRTLKKKNSKFLLTNTRLEGDACRSRTAVLGRNGSAPLGRRPRPLGESSHSAITKERANTHRRSIKLHGTACHLFVREKRIPAHTLRAARKNFRAPPALFIYSHRHKPERGALMVVWERRQLRPSPQIEICLHKGMARRLQI
jgi:hypothetical protein